MVFSWRTVPALPEPALGCTGCVLAAEMSHTRLYEWMASRGCVMMGTQSDSKQIRPLSAPPRLPGAPSSSHAGPGARLSAQECVCALVCTHTPCTHNLTDTCTPHTHLTPHTPHTDHNVRTTQITHTPHTLHTQHTHTTHISHTHYTHNTHRQHTTHTTHTPQVPTHP